MDEILIVKEKITSVICQNLGDQLGRSFDDANCEQPLPIFVDAAVEILQDSIGEHKAKETLKHILMEHRLWGMMQ